MARYIDAEPLEQLAAAMINNYRQSGQEEYELPWHGKLLFIQEAPTADVAPVVRCKDCVHGHRGVDNLVACDHPCGKRIQMTATCFCSFGSKKDESRDGGV